MMSERSRSLREFLRRNFVDNPHFWAIVSSTVLGVSAAYFWKNGAPLQYQSIAAGATVLACILGSICLLVRRFRKLARGLRSIKEEVTRIAAETKLLQKSVADLIENVRSLAVVVEHATKQMEHSSTDRALAVLNSVDALTVTVERTGNLDKDIRDASGDAAHQISNTFSSFCNTTVKACIKLLEKPSTSITDWSAIPADRIFVSRLGMWPSGANNIESRILLTRSWPLQLLYQDDDLAHFIENDLSTLRHVQTHTSGQGSLLVVRITSSEAAHLGFLWLESDCKGVFDPELAPKLARAFAVKLIPLLSPLVRVDRIREKASAGGQGEG